MQNEGETSSSSSSPNGTNDNDDDDVKYHSYRLWNLPDTVLFQILSFVAPRTHRSAVICHQLAPLSKDATQALLLLNDDDEDAKHNEPTEEDNNHHSSTASSIWDIILRQDYGVRSEHEEKAKKGTSSSRRACKRLRRSLLQRVKSAHRK